MKDLAIDTRDVLAFIVVPVAQVQPSVLANLYELVVPVKYAAVMELGKAVLVWFRSITTMHSFIVQCICSIAQLPRRGGACFELSLMKPG